LPKSPQFKATEFPEREDSSTLEPPRQMLGEIEKVNKKEISHR